MSPLSTRQHRSKPARCVAVADGRDFVGTVRGEDGRFVAIDADGAIVGKFGTLQQAVRAFPIRAGEVNDEANGAAP